ncbi:hypothetical protein BDV39DRAFT_167926, partial [Aspergillus sergii]
MHSVKRRAYPNRDKCPAMVKRRRILDSHYGVFEFGFGFGVGGLFTWLLLLLLGL